MLYCKKYACREISVPNNIESEPQSVTVAPWVTSYFSSLCTEGHKEEGEGEGAHAGAYMVPVAGVNLLQVS